MVAATKDKAKIPGIREAFMAEGRLVAGRGGKVDADIAEQKNGLCKITIARVFLGIANRRVTFCSYPDSWFRRSIGIIASFCSKGENGCFTIVLHGP
jgi:hypothetical protein